jgi:uncharacterized protein (TIGR02246 family)
MTPATKSNAREEQAIRHRVEEFVTGWNKHNPQAMSQVYADDADLINPFGRVAKSRTEIEKMFREEHNGAQKNSHMSLQPENLRFLASDVAVEDDSFEITGARDQSGKETTLRGHLTLVFKKYGDKWLAVTCRPMIPVPTP